MYTCTFGKHSCVCQFYTCTSAKVTVFANSTHVELANTTVLGQSTPNIASDTVAGRIVHVYIGKNRGINAL